MSKHYNDGYKDGYEWLTYKNRRHPSAKGGYIPGGPAYKGLQLFYGLNSDRDAFIASKDWHRGWVDGINKYVEDNNLSYPKVKK